MSAPYTIRMGWADLSSTEYTTLGVVPGGKRWVIRDLVANNGLATASAITVILITGGPQIILWNQALEPASSAHIEMRQAGYAGDSIVAIGGGAAVSLAITGYELDVISA